MVEWPVVDSVPRLSLVLYTGHRYADFDLKSAILPKIEEKGFKMMILSSPTVIFAQNEIEHTTLSGQVILSLKCSRKSEEVGV